MEFSSIRIYLLGGLLLHKAVWEMMKVRASRADEEPASNARRSRSLKARALSAVKLGILVAILIQTLVPDFLPLSQDPRMLRSIGLVFYTLGLVAAVTARIQLGRNWSDIEKARLQQDHALVARGLYRYVRHPIYGGDLLMLFGLELALNSWCVLGVIALIVYVRKQAIREERQLLQALPGYDQYCRRTTRFLPFLPV
jgi:protein-S-isoprenylcysteine O-methyltransferase Ste14